MSARIHLMHLGAGQTACGKTMLHEVSYVTSWQPCVDCRACIRTHDPQKEPPGQLYACTRRSLTAALRHPAVAGALQMLEDQGGSPEDLADAILEALVEG